MWLSFEARVDRGKKREKEGESGAQVVSLTTVKDVEGGRRRGGKGRERKRKWEKGRDSGDGGKVGRVGRKYHRLAYALTE